VFDRTNLLESLGDDAKFWADNVDITYLRQMGFSDGLPAGVAFSPRKGQNNSTPKDDPMGIRFGTVTRARAWYHDQIPPFDITLTALNEYGHSSRMIIRNVEILNSGAGISIDDITTDENMTFVATDIIHWHSLGWADPKIDVPFGQRSSSFVGT